MNSVMNDGNSILTSINTYIEIKLLIVSLYCLIEQTSKHY